MCLVNTTHIFAETVTGFKIAIKTPSGNYYSPSTGIRYKVGKVKFLDLSKNCDAQKIMSVNWPFIKGNLFSLVLVGKTSMHINPSEPQIGVISTKIGLINKRNKVVILRLTLSGDLVKGYSSGGKGPEVYAGRHIDKIEEL